MTEISPVELQKALKGAHYPSSRDELVRCAQDNGAEQMIMDELEHLPSGEFDNPSDVQKAVFPTG
ncbi:DUF2795 domain-containing protein [Kitasatospora sp. NPDC001132]